MLNLVVNWLKPILNIDLDQTFKKVSLSSTKIIYEENNGPILKVHPSHPSPPWRTEILDKVVIMIEIWNLTYTLIFTYQDYLWHQRWPNPPCSQSVTINDLQFPMEDRDSLQSTHHAKKLKCGLQADNHRLRSSMKSKKTPPSKSQVRKRQHHPSPPWRTTNLQSW